MKICMICPELGDAGGRAFIGGHVNNVLRLSEALVDSGHEVTILTTPHTYPGDQQKNDIEWAEVFCLPISGSYASFRYGLGFAIKALRKIRELNNEKNFDIIHGHSGYPILGLITGIAGEMVNIPSIHSLYCPIEPSPIFLNRTLSKVYFLQVNKIIAISRNVQKSLNKIGIQNDKIEIIPPAIKMSLYDPFIPDGGIRKYFNIDSDQTLLLHTTDLTKERGTYFLIEGLKIIVEQYPNIKLLMALNMPVSKYKGEKFEIKDKIMFYDLDDNIILLGITKKMPQIMASIDIFIAPFLNMAGIADYPISLLEAMACGKPVIATKVGGIPEIVKHKVNGLLVEPGDVHELKNALLYILENKNEAKRMGENAAKYVAENYSVDAIVEKMERIYEEVISNYSGNRRR